MQGKAMHIRQFGDPVLRRPAEPVAEINDEVRAVCAAMVEAMLRANGAGLAASQIGVPQRIIVLDVEGQFHILINPELLLVDGESEDLSEGCL
ncbi:MAG: peptide deformylase, partial [Candidatus Bipolaricaulota bacterium]|nr:peptide deformylase [Candidatus Bipolaricaulota bacterium]